MTHDDELNRRGRKAMTQQHTSNIVEQSEGNSLEDVITRTMLMNFLLAFGGGVGILISSGLLSLSNKTFSPILLAVGIGIGIIGGGIFLVAFGRIGYVFFLGFRSAMKRKQLPQLAKQKLTEPAKCDPSRFDDPVAIQTEWIPARRGGSGFRTHKLIERNPVRVEFRTTIAQTLLFLLLFCIGSLMCLLGYVDGFTEIELEGDEIPIVVDVILIVIGLLFSAGGVAGLVIAITPIVFDLRKGLFWKGWTVPSTVVQRITFKRPIRIEDIHALQLISERCQGEHYYYSYELNLVLKDGKRINVVDHANLAKIREDAQTLSTFLNKPLWDATRLVTISGAIR
jgi:hypothetical protein